MSAVETAPLASRRLPATDLRRLPMLGIALGIAIAAFVLGVIERGTLATVTVAVMWLVVAVMMLAVLPIANTLTLDHAGFRIRALGVFTRFVPWTDVRSIETGEGWAGGALIIELAEPADRGMILGLPRDPTFGKRALVDSYGCDTEELAHMMENYRAGAHP